MKVICPYCSQAAQLVDGDVIYPHRKDLHILKFYSCKACNAYVGTHKQYSKKHGWVPLGRLANKELREAKKEAHFAFDPLWKDGKISRKEAYRMLSEALNISYKDCHIGMFDIETCQKVKKIVKELKS